MTPTIPILYLSILVLALSAVIDGIMGEYPNPVHPVVWIGKAISAFEGVFRKLPALGSGVLFVLFIESVSILLVAAALHLVAVIWELQVVVLVYILKSTYSIRGMRRHVMPILRSMEREDIESARSFLSKVVRRDVNALPPELINSAAIETLAEGFVDGVISPLLYFSLFGIFGAVAYRVANTFDSMIAYKDQKNIQFGRFAALLDSVFNYIPARLSSIILYSSGLLLGYRPHSYSILRNSAIPDSANAGWSMGAMANCLGVRLEKHGDYVLNEDMRQPDTRDLRRSLRLFTFASYFSIIFVVLPLMISIYMIP